MDEEKIKENNNEEKTNEVNKKENKEKKKKTRKKAIITSAIIITILIILAIISTIFSLINMNKETIMSGVTIQGIDVSKLTSKEAKEKIENIYNEKKENNIEIKYNEYETIINPKSIEVKFNIDKAVQEAKNIGRNKNIFLNNYEIIKTMIFKNNIEIDLTINEEILKKEIENIETNLPGVVEESGYYVDKDKLKITKGKKGLKIDIEKMIEETRKYLKTTNVNEKYIEIPTKEKEPEKIDIEKIHNEIYKEVKNAYYTQDPFKIYPEEEGIDFNIEEAKKILEEDKEEYIINLIITKPEITIDKIGTKAFPDQLSSSSTMYDGGLKGRTTNLQIACSKINGKVVLPGEVFSYNKALGPRTASAGYKNAKIYQSGEVIDGLGGGICQISTTLYNAILKANLEPVERRNHQFVTSYIGPGLDATVVYGVTDFKFKNTRKYPIKIAASAKNGMATVSIYGIKEDEEYKVSLRTEIVSTIPTSTKYIEDPNMPIGKEVIKQKGANGKKTQTYITKTLNGKVVSSKVLSRDTYDAMQTIIIKGTKKVREQLPEKPKEDKPIENEKPKEEKPIENEKPKEEKPVENEKSKEDKKPKEKDKTKEEKINIENKV